MSRIIRKRPLIFVATAFGIGFVAGGAMSTGFQRIAIAAAARYVARRLLAQVLSKSRDKNELRSRNPIPENHHVQTQTPHALD